LARIGDSDPVVVLGSSAAIENANAQKPGWMKVEKVL
jgi:hypothetical protein